MRSSLVVAASLAAIAAARPAADPAPSTFPITGNDVKCYAGPGKKQDVVKTYKNGDNIKITCQVKKTKDYPGTTWDKTPDGCFVPDHSVDGGSPKKLNKPCNGQHSTSSGSPSSTSRPPHPTGTGRPPVPTGSPGGDGPGNADGGDCKNGGDIPKSLTSLDETQTKYARTIMCIAKKQNLGEQGCLAGITTALVETKIYMYANKEKVPESMNLAYDKVGNDHDSVGLFQHRQSFYPDIGSTMDPVKSTQMFFKEMKEIGGWQNMNVGDLCQKVQQSEKPDAYSKQVGKAKKICEAGGMVQTY